MSHSAQQLALQQVLANFDAVCTCQFLLSHQAPCTLIHAAEEDGILDSLARPLSFAYLAAPSESPVTVLLTVSFQEAFSRPCQNLLMSLSALTTPRLLRSDRQTQPEHPWLHWSASSHKMCLIASATVLMRHTGRKLLTKPSSASGQQHSGISVQAPAACALRYACGVEC